MCIRDRSKPASADRFRIMSLQALVAWKEGDIELAVGKLEDVYNQGFKNTNIYQNLGIMYNLSGDYEKALAFNKEAYDYNSDDNIIVDNLADTYSLMGEYKAVSYTHLFCSTGAEANEGAIKLAKKYQVEKGNKNKIEFVTLKNSFHGRTLATVAATGQPKYQAPYQPLIEKFVHIDRDDISALENAVNENTAGIMIELIQGESCLLYTSQTGG